MAKHGGEVRIKSQFNRGTTITLLLPKKRVIRNQSNNKTIGNLSKEITYGINSIINS